MGSTIGSYLIDRLYESGVKHLFGIPGDYVLGLYKLLEASPIQLVGTTREEGGGFAADAYARLNGIGAACVTYCVGGLNTVNAVACAYAERSPVVLLSGSPGMGERRKHPYLHHMVRDFSTQLEVYKHITVAAEALEDPLTAPRRIDRALALLNRYKLPIYLEIPRDLVNAPIETPPAGPADDGEASDPDALAEAVAEATEMLVGARTPVALAGAEVHRFGLHDTMLRLVERLQVPVATTLLGKSVIREDHPLSIGIYGGLIGHDDINKFVDDSDCCLMLGSVMTDIDAGDLALSRCIHATADRVAIRRHEYPDVHFQDFIRALSEAPLKPSPRRQHPPHPAHAPLSLDESAQTTMAGLFQIVNNLLDEKTLVIADVGESLFASADLKVHDAAGFLSPAYYTSMGFGMPAALGAGMAAPDLRPLVLVGDGAFQMTGTEYSTCIRYGLKPIVIVLNNHGYSTERAILEGSFNDIANWNYERVCDLIGSGVSHVAHTHAETASALAEAAADPTRAHVINVHLDPNDRSPAMQRVASRLAARIATEKSGRA